VRRAFGGGVHERRREGGASGGRGGGAEFGDGGAGDGRGPVRADDRDSGVVDVGRRVKGKAGHSHWMTCRSVNTVICSCIVFITDTNFLALLSPFKTRRFLLPSTMIIDTKENTHIP
jgi:hypothetical protein